MFINLTGIELNHLYEEEVEEVLLEHDSQIIADALGDIDRVDEVAAILLAYEPKEIALDVDEDYFDALKLEMPGVKLTLGVIHEHLES